MHKLTICFALCSVLLLSAGKSVRQPQGPFQVQCGDIRIELEPRYYWNINGIWYRNICAGQKEQGFYGTVIRYADKGWVGTGHMENGIGEKITSLNFFRDGIPFCPDGKTVLCRRFKMTKRAVLHLAELEYELEVEDGIIRETAGIRMLKQSGVKLLYHFMHNWDNTFTSYRTLSREGKSALGIMPMAKKGELLHFPHPAAAAFYAPSLGIGVLSQVQSCSSLPDEWRFWNRGRQDRKMYYTALKDEQTVPEGFTGTWRMTTVFFRADEAAWNTMPLAADKLSSKGMLP